VPKVRFKGFTDEWEQRKLGELVTYQNGVGHESNQLDEGKYELVNLNSIAIDGGLKNSGKFINKTAETLLKNDLVMVLSDVGHGDLLGRVAIIPENYRYVLNQRVALLRGNSQTNIRFLFSYINAHQMYFKREGAGSSQLNISRGSVERFKVYLPSISEQKQIGKTLFLIDRTITLHEEQHRQLERLKKALLQKMFADETGYPALRFKGFTEKWEQSYLKDIASVNSGRDYKHLNKGNIPVYGTGGYMLSVDKALSNTKDGIGIGRKGTINNPYILKAPFWTVDTLFYVIPYNVDLNFLYGIFQKIDWRKKDESTGVPSLSKENINKTKFKIPAISEQKEIGTIFQNLDTLI
ncbi:restriction endonuclease subunit S, partial [Limosilactobacillus mucosae]|uniref:restriction endonuclease subunit S n=1 Tax=Limosilactobacillus mucosae TaxID=97478 RepID=UPI0022E31143